MAERERDTINQGLVLFFVNFKPLKNWNEELPLSGKTVNTATRALISTMGLIVFLAFAPVFSSTSLEAELWEYKGSSSQPVPHSKGPGY